MNIEINVSDVASYGKQMVECSGMFDDSVKEFNALIDAINTIWDGADALKYVNTMREKYIVGLNELKEYMLEYGTYLQKVPESYSALDEVFSSKNIDV